MPLPPEPPALRARLPRPWIAVLSTLLAVAAPVAPAQEEPAPGGRLLTPETELIVGMSRESSIYSHYENDRASGFAVEVLDAIAAEMQLKIRRVPLGLNDILGELESGRIDMVQLWAETKERREIADFSVPVLLLKLAVVVRTDDPRIRTLADLDGRTIATGSVGSVATEFVQKEIPGARVQNTSVPLEVLESVSTGACDAAIVARLSALWGIKEQGLSNLRVLDVPIQGYDIRHCLAVRKGDAVLLGRLNEGLAIIRGDGRFSEIHDRWLGEYEPRRFTSLEVVILLAIALGAGLALALVAFLRQRRLTRRIASQAGELLGQRSLHAALFDNHPLSTCVLEAAADGGSPRVLSLNRVAGRLCGMDPVSATGRPLATLSLSPELRGYFDEVVSRWPAPGETAQVEIQLRDSRTLLETTLVALAPGSSGAARMCVLSADVTRRRLADREIAQNRRMRALGELVGGIAHEFNNLLTPVLAQASLLSQEHGHDANLVSELRLIEDAARRSAALTRRLLAFGRRGDEGTPSAEVRTVLESCVALVRPTCDRRITWHVELPADLPAVSCDATDLHQIAFNLIINARDTLMERLGEPGDSGTWSPRLAVSVRALAPETHLPRQPRPGATLLGWQQLVVEDNGKGIPPEDLERIYEPFFTTKDPGRGTGIGLATVWHLVSEAGGLIDVESTVGTGTRFLVHLPAWSTPGTATAPSDSPAAPVAATPPAAGATHSILMVEDESIVAGAVLASLRRLGHRAVHRTNGEAAWEEMQARPDAYDVLLVDINMPRMNGVDFVRRVRTTRWGGRIIVMSGRVAEPDMRELERLRIDRVLIKPFTPDDIAAALRPGSGTHGGSG